MITYPGTTMSSPKNPVLAFLANVVLLCVCSTASAHDSIRYEPGKTITAHQWDVTDIQFQVDSPTNHPVDVDIAATFTHSQSGRALTVPGFYNDDNEYIVRFTPAAEGEWNYKTTSSISELNDRSGQVSVQLARDGRRGAVLIDPESKTRFIHENGDEYYPIAFEADWLFALDAQNANDIPKTRKLVDTLNDNGFNQVVMNVFAYDVDWKKDDSLNPKDDYGSPDVFPFLGTNQAPDHSHLNIEYFQRLDRVIDYLDQKGIVAHLMIYVWNKQVAWPEANSDSDNRYFDYVVRRYQAFPNLVWDVSKEALGYGHTDVGYITERIARLRENDAYDRLITVHDYGYCRNFPEQVDFVSVQLWTSELYGVMREVRQAIPGKPILNIEHGGYERSQYVVFTGNYTSPETCLERAYQCVFAGTYPTHYWQAAAWNVIIPDIAALPPDDRPRLDYYQHMRKLIDRYKIGQLKAGQQKSNAGFCLHNDAGLLLFYVPSECEFFGLRPPKDRGDTMTLTWFDPFTGEFGETTQMKMTQWPSVKVPSASGFRILVCEIKE